MSHTCAICTRKLEDQEWVYSAWTGNRYCLPGEGCFTVGSEKRESGVALKGRIEKVKPELAETFGERGAGAPFGTQRGDRAGSAETKSRAKPAGSSKGDVLPDLSKPFLPGQ